MRNPMSQTAKALFTVLLAGQLIACEKHASSFSLLPDQTNYVQSGETVSRKIDILWVIDNSGSMKSSQDNLAANFKSFITRLKSLNYDFHMAVTTTDTFMAKWANKPQLARVRDGSKTAGHSGVFVMDQNTPDLEQVFITNITQGTAGYGDERAFSSFREALQSNLNADFRRQDAFLAVIIVSDEDDFSAETGSYLYQDYDSPLMHPITDYVTYLDSLTGNQGTRNFNVSAIAAYDQACLDKLNAEIPGRILGRRYAELVDATGGVKGSICDNFGDSLSVISDTIIELSSTFVLSRVPIEETIRVIVNGVSVPKDESNGWSYNAAENSVTFHGSAVPAQGSNIIIDFDPVTIKN